MESWASWEAKYCPVVNDATHYLELLRTRNLSFVYHFPLQVWIVDKYSIVSTERIELEQPRNDTNDTTNFVWPPLLAAALNSVCYSSNPNPPEPRIYVSQDQTLQSSVAYFNQVTTAYYDVLQNGPAQNVKQNLVRKIGYPGEKPSLSKLYE